MDGIIQSIMDWFTSWMTSSTDNVLTSAIQSYQAVPSADLHQTWMQSVLGTMVALVMIVWILALVVNGIRALFNNLEPIVTTIVDGPKAILGAMYLTPIVMLAVYANDWLGWLFQYLAKIIAGDSDWQQVFVLKNVALQFQDAFWGFILSKPLQIQATTTRYAVYYFALMMAFALCAYTFAGVDSVLYVFAKAGLVMAVFTKSTVMAILAIGGSLITRVGVGGPETFGVVLILVVMAVLAPGVIFALAFIAGWRKRKVRREMVDSRKEEHILRFTTGDGVTERDLRESNRQARRGIVRDTSSHAIQAASEFAVTKASASVPGVGTGIAIGSTAILSYLKRKG